MMKLIIICWHSNELLHHDQLFPFPPSSSVKKTKFLFDFNLLLVKKRILRILLDNIYYTIRK